MEGRNEGSARKAIEKINSSRSAEADKQAVELATTRMELDSTRSKLDAAVSRRKVSGITGMGW